MAVKMSICVIARQMAATSPPWTGLLAQVQAVGVLMMSTKATRGGGHDNELPVSREGAIVLRKIRSVNYADVADT